MHVGRSRQPVSVFRQARRVPISRRPCSAVRRSQRDKTLQVAPINGVVAEIPSKVGTFAVASLSSTALMTIADMSTINVEVKVDETSIDKVDVGQKAKIKVDAFGDKELLGEVKQKTPLAVGKSQTSGGLQTNINVQEAKEFRVVIELKDLAEDIRSGLRPGMARPPRSRPRRSRTSWPSHCRQ